MRRALTCANWKARPSRSARIGAHPMSDTTRGATARPMGKPNGAKAAKAEAGKEEAAIAEPVAEGHAGKPQTKRAPPNGPAPTGMPSLEAIDNLADIAKRSGELIRLHAEKLKTDDGYQVIDSRTVAATFQELTQKAVLNPAPLIKAQFAFWSDMTALWQRTVTRVLSGAPAEPVIAPSSQDKRFKDERWTEHAYFDFWKQYYLLLVRCLQDS